MRIPAADDVRRFALYKRFPRSVRQAAPLFNRPESPREAHNLSPKLSPRRSSATTASPPFLVKHAAGKRGRFRIIRAPQQP
jgi:hypothetical protein